MSFLAIVFGSSKPTTATANARLAVVEADLAAMPARIAAADAALKSIADMTDAEHADAEAEAASLRRQDARLKDQRKQLSEARDRAEAEETADDLSRRRDVAAKRAAAYGKLVDEYDDQSAALASTLGEMREVERAADAINREIAAAEKAGLRAPARVKTPDDVYRSEKDVVEPDRTVVEDQVVFTEVVTSFDHDGNTRYESRDVPVGIAQRVGGKVMLGPGEKVAKVERVIPGKTIYGKRIGSPTENAVLPAARIGGEAFWPK